MSKDVRMVASDTSKAPGPFLPKRAKSAPSPFSMKRSQTSFNLLDDAQKAHDESRTLGRRQLKILIGTTVAEAFSFQRLIYHKYLSKLVNHKFNFVCKIEWQHIRFRWYQYAWFILRYRASYVIGWRRPSSFRGVVRFRQ